MKIGYFLCVVIIAVAPSNARVRRQAMRFIATANSVDGTTAKGTRAHQGVVAADPKVLPLGSRIRVSGAGPYSGVYLVTDTGPSVKGRKIDLFLNSAREARRFGKKAVIVRVLSRGDNERDRQEVTPPAARRSGR